MSAALPLEPLLDVDEVMRLTGLSKFGASTVMAKVGGRRIGERGGWRIRRRHFDQWVRDGHLDRYLQHRASTRPGARRADATVPSDRGLYFLQCNGGDRLIKIGRAVCLRTRVAGIRNQSGMPLVLLATLTGQKNYAIEFRLHERFAEIRAHGEWFYPAPRLVSFIEEIVP